MRKVVLFCSLIGCVDGGSKDSEDSRGSDDSQGSDDSGMGGGPCGEAGICVLEARDAVAACGDSATGLEAGSDAVGELTVTHGDYTQGCCPTLAVSGEANQRNGQISVSYALSDDLCDCICDLDLRYTLVGIPSGGWTLLVPGGQSLSVTVQ